jgi:hypothetical protein
MPQLSDDTIYVSYGFIPIPVKVMVSVGMVMVMEKCTCGIPVKNPMWLVTQYYYCQKNVKISANVIIQNL